MLTPKVFISYSHDSVQHRQRVLELSDRLNTDAIDCDIDQYIKGSPEEGWPLWMEKKLNEAKFVLVVCTENYLNPVQRKGKSGTGKGVKWESLLVYQDIYENDSLNQKFVPVIFNAADAKFMPKPLKAVSHYDLDKDDGYEMLCRYLTGQPLAVKPSPGQKLHLPPKNIPSSKNTKIHTDRLPTTRGKFFGRVDELKLLDDAWANPQTHIVQFIAPGGTGKTKLLRHWLDRTAGIEALIAWSFYSQGSSEDKQVSATPFFSHAFAALGSDKTTFTSEDDKGEHLVNLLHQQRCVLVLDGLEPLQHASRGMQGELKDRAICALLKNLAGHSNGLCVITTRIAVDELNGRGHVISHNLQNLALADGVSLLRSLGVQGGKANKPEQDQLEEAVEEYGRHALALNLLGNAIYIYLDGNVLQRYKLADLTVYNGKDSRHAFKVMQAYVRWLTVDGIATAELNLLYLLGLFDHPIGPAVLRTLWAAQIPDLTAGIAEHDWKRAIVALRDDHHLLSMHEDNPNLLDCHPLIHEYFGGQLQNCYPDAWQQAHERLYEYYKALPKKELPDTLEEMQPLFSAIAHGCAAGLHQRALDEIYWPRIRREQEAYIAKRLGAYIDNLAVITSFFIKPWQTPVKGLGGQWRPEVLNWAGFDLRAMGRLRDAVEPMQAAVENFVDEENWKEAADSARGLSEIQLTIGNIKAAIDIARESVKRANQIGNQIDNQRMCITSKTTLAYVLHQASRTDEAWALYRQAEQHQHETDPKKPRLYSLWGFRYCNLLLARGEELVVLERAKYALKFAETYHWPLGIALDQLSLGRAHLQLACSPNPQEERVQEVHWQQAADWLGQAVVSLREAGTRHYLPLGLLARTAYFRYTQDFAKAYKDLQEVFDLAEGGEMRLHLTDYHLEAARLALAEDDCDKAQVHTQAAAKLIEATGYNRRLQELEALRAAQAD